MQVTNSDRSPGRPPLRTRSADQDRLSPIVESRTVNPANARTVVCPNCAAVRKGGKWSWGSVSVDAPRLQCPACKRIAESKPAAVVHIQNALIDRKREELFALIRNVESNTTQRDPLERIIAVSTDVISTSVFTTGEVIADRIAKAISDVSRATVTTRISDGIKGFVVG